MDKKKKKRKTLLYFCWTCNKKKRCKLKPRVTRAKEKQPRLELFVSTFHRFIPLYSLPLSSSPTHTHSNAIEFKRQQFRRAACLHRMRIEESQSKAFNEYEHTNTYTNTCGVWGNHTPTPNKLTCNMLYKLKMCQRRDKTAKCFRIH